MGNFDHEVDILVVGSGAGAMTAAITAADAGADVLVVEKAAHYGGTSATSGGGIWIPNSHYAEQAGAVDSDEDAILYMKSVIGDRVDDARIRAYVEEGRKMLVFLEEKSDARFEAVPYSDYYPEQPGGRQGWRTHEPVPMSSKKLGADFETLCPQHHQTLVAGRIGMTMKEGRKLLTRAPGWVFTGAKVMLSYWFDIPGRLKGKRARRLTLGNALCGRLRLSMLKKNIPLWLNSPLDSLIVEGDDVLGAVITHEGKTLRVRAKKGVIMGAGGFEHDQAMREKYLPSPTKAEWSGSQTNNTGDAIKAGQALGAETDLMNQAWWIPAIPAVTEGKRPWMLFAERSLPGNVIVNSRGERFANEAYPYLESGEAMYKANEPGAITVPSYVVFDATFRHKYPFGPLMPGNMQPDSKLSEKIRDILYISETIEDLAEKIGADPRGLAETIRRNNDYAKTGEDPEFHRGRSFYDQYYGDATNKPSPCIAAIDKPPYYAMALYPGDIGTKGGLLTDDKARVKREGGSTFTGLYAIGNTAASVMGETYPGAGATIGPSMVFGYIAARHATGQN